jgi:NADH-quinone oxidoreductase subunit G
MGKRQVLTIDGKEIEIAGEKNLLELIRKANIDIPTFCYHSELSIYGACRLCLVEIEGRGIQSSCSTPPQADMKVRTNTSQIRSIRKMIIELLLANESHDCTICPKNGSCELQRLAKKLGITEIRFKKEKDKKPVDSSTLSLIRDPNKCILCGDCVRICSEVQGIGVIDFAYRGKDSTVICSFGKEMNKVECVLCGQCARVCPTGAITIKKEIDAVWNAINDPKKTVVAQIAPAVRVALGEEFSKNPGDTNIGQIITGLKTIGFDKVFDTSFAADMTVIEEGDEFLKRISENKNLPLFTSCCPAWVKYVEQYRPEYIDNLSSCKSPQQMFGSIVKEYLPQKLGIKREDLVIVSIMPCTAKKFEAKRVEFMNDGMYEVDHVITTQELSRMFDEAGVMLNNLTPESFDMPYGFKSGAGIIFGSSGGVSEAVLRYVTEQLDEKKESCEFKTVRGMEGLRTLSFNVKGREIRLGIVNGLKNAKQLMHDIEDGKIDLDIIEVMACPGGCVGGGGQPVYKDPLVKIKRSSGLYENDKMMQLHKSQENPYVMELYQDKKLHHLLHTGYQSRKRIDDEYVNLVRDQNSGKKLEITVCFGTSCYLKGSQNIMKAILDYVEKNNLLEKISVKASFCFEKCGRGPVVDIGGNVIEHCTKEMAIDTISKIISREISLVK